MSQSWNPLGVHLLSPACIWRSEENASTVISLCSGDKRSTRTGLVETQDGLENTLNHTASAVEITAILCLHINDAIWIVAQTKSPTNSWLSSIGSWTNQNSLRKVSWPTSFRTRRYGVLTAKSLNGRLFRSSARSLHETFPHCSTSER